MATITLSFQGHIPGTVVPNPGRHANFLSLLVRDERYQPVLPLLVREDGGLTGLSLGWGTQIDFDKPVNSFELVVSCFSTPGLVEVYDDAGSLRAHVPIDRIGSVGRAHLSLPGIRRLYVSSPQDETNLLLLRLDGVREGHKTKNLLFDQQIIIAEGLTKEVCSEVVFGETATLRAPNTEDRLVGGRTFIASVAYNRYLDDRTRFAPRKHPTNEELNDSTIRKHWDLCNDAAEAAQGVAIGNCRHFVVWRIDQSGTAPSMTPRIVDDWPYTYASKIKEKFGPFKNYSFPTGNDIHIFKYCGVP